jgi:hypothetical protein
VKFKYFFLTTALISLQSHAMLKKNVLSLIRYNKNTKIMTEYHEKKLTNVELDRWNNAIELEEYHAQIIHQNKKIPKKLSRTFSSISSVESV